MAAPVPISHFAPLILLSFIFLSTCHLPILATNITSLISAYSNLTDFTHQLDATSIAADLSKRSSLTILAVPNDFLHVSSASNISDALRYHVLLEYISWDALRTIPPEGKVVATLFQTTGRAPGILGAVNITWDPVTNKSTVHLESSNAIILDKIADVPFNISILSVSSLLVPSGIDLMASETRPSPGISITKALIDGHGFNVAASMLTASGVEEEFERDESGAGLTLFIPTDEAFADLPNSVGFQSLPADQKASVLRFHVLHSYYPLGSLEKVVNPIQPTLETEKNWAGSFTLNISKINGSLTIGTGNVVASVTQTVFDQNPVAIFGISQVLLPVEIFGKNRLVVNTSGGGGVPDRPPVSSLSPVNSPSGNFSSSPPGSLQDVASSATNGGIARKFWIVWWCIGFHLLVISNYYCIIINYSL
ncbi:unnamed protein product [Cuscuta europaea]|uniref:FAS1 domain-containing protein n=1 Tax=Cuscuta europaea TaxID=41803 RepID=A0A9P0YRV6_CUSEU|nr:unnamed protein product [Cuscuta europaea]